MSLCDILPPPAAPDGKKNEGSERSSRSNLRNHPRQPRRDLCVYLAPGNASELKPLVVVWDCQRTLGKIPRCYHVVVTRVIASASIRKSHETRVRCEGHTPVIPGITTIVRGVTEYSACTSRFNSYITSTRSHATPTATHRQDSCIVSARTACTAYCCSGQGGGGGASSHEPAKGGIAANGAAVEV